MDYSLPGSSVHGISQARILGCHFLLQVIFPTQGSNLCLLHCRWILYQLSNQRSPLRSEELLSRSGGEKGLRGSGAGTLGVPLGGTRRVQGILQARILEWVAFPSSGDHPDLGIEPASPALQADSLLLSHQGSPIPASCLEIICRLWYSRGALAEWVKSLG